MTATPPIPDSRPVSRPRKEPLEERAARFAALHRAPEILVLPNAWDAASARIFAACGARAIGTTSMGIAAAAGLPDVECISREAVFEALSAIDAAVDLPVTADLESGYATEPEGVAATVLAAMEAGAVGANLEDGTGQSAAPLRPLGEQVERLAAARSAARERGVPFVLNARTDVYLVGQGTPAERLAAAVERGNAYLAAGADCVFVPGGLDRETLRALVGELNGPLNVVANPAISRPLVPPVPELERLGVARVSIGSGAMRATLSLVRRMAEELLAGDYDTMRTELEREGAVGAYRMAIGEQT